MPSKKESADSGADLLAGVVAIGSLVANLLQAADRDQLTQERDTLRARLRQATGMIQTLQEQVRIRTAHYQTLRAAYVALKQETTELNQIVDASAKEADRLQQAAVKAGDAAIRAMPDFQGWGGRSEQGAEGEAAPAGRIVRRGRVQVRTVAEPAVATAWAIGQAVRAARLKGGLTQGELARRTGMDRPNIARIESGRHAASTGTILRICKALGVPMAALVAAPGPDADDEALAQAGVERWNDLVDGEAEP